MILPTEAELMALNRMLIERFGGSFTEANGNLANPASLRYVLQEIDATVFGRALYPDTISRAARLAWVIITRHVFHDGNMRTGMAACQLVLRANGYNWAQPPAGMVDTDLIDTAVQIAAGQISVPEFIAWIKSRTTQ